MMFRKNLKTCKEKIATLRDLLDGPNEFIAAGFERFRPLNEMNMSTRCFSRSSSRTRNQSRSPASSILPSLKQHCEQFNKGYSSNGEFTVCQIFIKSGQNDPQTNETYSTACTANPTITICNKYQSTQPILLRSAYICTLNFNDENVQVMQDNELNETNTTDSTQQGPFFPGSIDYFENPSSITMNSLKFNENNSVSLNRLLSSEEESNILSGTTFTYELSFPCMRWLSRFKGDGSLIREIAAPGTQPIDQTPRFGRILRVYPLDVTTLFQQEERAPVIQYQVITKTGNLWNSGMNNTTRVNILLQGDCGDTGTRTLWNEEITKINAFSRGKTSIFYVEAVFLGRLKSLTLWLEPEDDENNKCIPTSWYLEYVIIQQLSVNCLTYNRSKISNTLSSMSTSSFLVTNNCNKISNDISAIYMFPCFQWLTTGFGMNSLPIKLIPANRNGVLATDLIESIIANQKEQIFWQAEKWKFKPGTKIVLYSYLTGAPMRMIDSNRIDCQPTDSVTGVSTKILEKDFVKLLQLIVAREISYITVVFNVSYAVTGSRHSKTLKPPSNQRFNTKNVFNSHKRYKVYQNEDYSNASSNIITCNTIINNNNNKITSNLDTQCYDFKIRPQSNRFIALEINKGNSLRSRKLHVYVGPDGRIVSGATGPITIPGKLFLPYVKGCLRDHTILWLCTEIQQTLIPVLIHQTNEDNSEVKINSCKFDLRATGERNTEAYWRVHKVDKNVRRFESVAWPGHFLRVTSDCVDVMGGGGMDCYFQIIRIRCKGFLQLSPLVNIKKIIGMNEDGTITLYDKYTMEEYSHDKTDESKKAQRIESKISSSRQQQQMFELVQCHNQIDVKDVDSTKSTFGDDSDSNDNGSNQPQGLDSPNENQDIKENVGMIYKIRLEVNQIDPGVQSEWEVDKVILENVEASKSLIFDFSGRPFGKYKNFCCLSREQVTSINSLHNTSITMKQQLNNELKLFLLNYRIQIEFNYDVSNGKDLSNISIEPYICLIGQYGDCGRRLIGSITGKQLISVEKRNVLILDTLIEAAYLGEVSSCFLGPVDVEEKSQEERTGLLCTDILIWDTKKEVIYEFPSETWLLPKGNEQTHEIHLKVAHIHPMQTYEMESIEDVKPSEMNQLGDQSKINETGNKNESQDVHYNTEDELDILRDGMLV
ncbi:Lipoxygenase homology domain-containing protein 1 [Schistosoma japonicum]|nr:Lipoxygenase homology domain-containing protein 1 [Schistosoma japonicum]